MFCEKPQQLAYVIRRSAHAQLGHVWGKLSYKGLLLTLQRRGEGIVDSHCVLSLGVSSVK